MASFAITHLPYPASATSNATVPLYLHHLPSNVTISGVRTSQILNTTTLWPATPGTTPNLRYNVFNSTLYPALTSNLTSIGSGSLILWVTVSGAPGSLNATLYDANAAGQLAVVTTSQVITLNSSPAVPYKLTLGFNINHTFTQSSTIKLSLTVFKISQLFVWYDSASTSSALIIPVANIPRISLIQTFDYNFNPQNTFSLNWTSSQRIVFLTVHVADPFGAYNVANCTITITGPGPTIQLSQPGNSLTTNPSAPEKLFALNWPYPTTLPAATYTVSATANDTGGDQDTNTVNMYLTSSNSPPQQQPPPGSPFPYLPIIIGTILGILALLLAFLFLTKRHRVKCPKCGAKVKEKLDKCPACGTPLTSAALEPNKPA
jgi:hypothetical protein